MMTRDPRLLHATRLLELHAAGHFGLPDALIEAGAKLEAMRAAMREASATSDEAATGNVVERLAGEMVAAGSRLKPGAIEATVAAIDEAERRRRASELAVQVTRRALELAEQGLASAIDEHRDEILGHRLAPALATVLETVRVAADPLAAADLREPQRLFGDAKKGAAYQAVLQANVQHGAIREAQRHALGGNLPDPPELAIYRNAPEIFSAAGIDWRSRRQFGKVPWPEDPIECLIWTATEPGVEAWIPTPAEFAEVAQEAAATTRLRPLPTMVG